MEKQFQLWEKQEAFLRERENATEQTEHFNITPFGLMSTKGYLRYQQMLNESDDNYTCWHKLATIIRANPADFFAESI